MAKSEECAEWQKNCASLNQRGLYLLKSRLWSDCSFRVCDHIFEGHKLFLAMASPVFANMFFGSLPEGNDPILIKGIDIETFGGLLEYIYTDKVTIDSLDEAIELYYAADRYMMSDLLRRCSAEIASRLAPANVCGAYESATQCRDTLLMDKCLQYISLYTRKVLEDSSFMTIDLTTMEKIFALECMDIDSELELLNAMTRYIEAHKEKTDEDSDEDSEQEPVSSTPKHRVLDTERELLLRDVLKQIRFLTLSPSQFADFHTASSLLSESECFGILMNIASSSSKVAMPEGFSKIRNKRLKKTTQQQKDKKSSASRKLETVYCTRSCTKPNGYYENDFSQMSCTVMFSADRDLALIGAQVPTQLKEVKMTDLYLERVNIAVKLWTGGNNKTIVTGSLSAAVNYNSFMDVKFENACFLTKNQVYVLYLTFGVNGKYPCSLYTGKATVGVDEQMATISLIDNSDQNRANLVKSFIIQY